MNNSKIVRVADAGGPGPVTGQAAPTSSGSIAVRYWAPDGVERVAYGFTTGQAMDRAEAAGAIRMVDCHGVIYRNLAGTFYVIGTD